MQALRDGIVHVLTAPVVLFGTIGAVLIYGAPIETLQRGVGALLVAAFLSGGVIDRYARGRPTRAPGFFAACGAHLGAMLRTWLFVFAVILLFHAVVGEAFANPYVHAGGFVVALLLNVLVIFAQVRIAVEDRRSASGALLAAARFIVRNPAAAGIVLLVAGLELLSMLGYERLLAGGQAAGWGALALTNAWIATETFCVLVSVAAAVSLFQGRLAHVGYTAAPPRLWPESPAAEAIANAPPTITP